MNANYFAVLESAFH